jgi:polar amino acid transport system substrate-binding protein
MPASPTNTTPCWRRYQQEVSCVSSQVVECRHSSLALLCRPVEAREWDAIKQSGTLIAATEGGFQPFNYYDGPKLTGFEVDLAEAIAKKLGLKLEWRVVPFDGQIAALKQDRFDFAIASHGYTAERAKSVDFANPHYCTGGQIAAHKDGPLTVAALDGKTVGVQLATSYADAAKKVKGIKTIKTYKGDPKLCRAACEEGRCLDLRQVHGQGDARQEPGCRHHCR